MDAVYKRILKKLGPDALKVYRALEELADENGVVRADAKQIAAILNRKRKEAAP